MSWLRGVGDLYSFLGIGLKQLSYESCNVLHRNILLKFSPFLVEFISVFRNKKSLRYNMLFSYTRSISFFHPSNPSSNIFIPSTNTGSKIYRIAFKLKIL